MTETGPDRLVREAAQGHVDVVRDIVMKFPDKVSAQFMYNCGHEDYSGDPMFLQ